VARWAADEAPWGWRPWTGSQGNITSPTHPSPPASTRRVSALSAVSRPRPPLSPPVFSLVEGSRTSSWGSVIIPRARFVRDPGGCRR
jgi:hypothetical protein